MIKLKNVPHDEPLQDNPLQWSGARGDPPVTAGVRGHPGYGYKARSDPALYCARGDPPVIRKSRADPSEVGLICSVLYGFWEPDGGGMGLFPTLSGLATLTGWEWCKRSRHADKRGDLSACGAPDSVRKKMKSVRKVEASEIVNVKAGL